MPELHARSIKRERNPKPTPDLELLKLRGQYSPSKDGIDANLLILLHGIGDTEAPFFTLGKQLSLPQTAVLSLRGPLEVPLVGGAQWMDSFDLLSGDRAPFCRRDLTHSVIPNPNPTQTLKLLHALIDDLRDHEWPDGSIHLFGFAQGGSVAVELARTAPPTTRALIGSVVSISGPLLSHPATSDPSCRIPLLAWRRIPEKASPFRRVFADVTDFVASDPTKQGMPASRAEFEPIVRFYSTRLRHKQPFEVGEGGEEAYALEGGRALGGGM